MVQVVVAFSSLKTEIAFSASASFSYSNTKAFMVLIMSAVGSA